MMYGNFYSDCYHVIQKKSNIGGYFIALYQPEDRLVNLVNCPIRFHEHNCGLDSF